MLIALDIRPIQGPDSCYRGIGEYGRNFLQHLLSKDTTHSYILFCNKGDSLTDFDIPKDVEICYLKRLKRLRWVQDQIFLPFEISSKKIDLFHALGFNLPILKTTKIVVTIHDVIPLVLPGQYLPTNSSKLWYSLQVKFLNQADRIIVNSNYTKNDLVRFIDIPKEKIKLIYYGLNPIYSSAVNENAWAGVKNEFKINKEYLLYVGGLDNRKNIPFLLSAFKTMRGNTDISLVIVGAYGNKDQPIFNLVKELELDSDVIFTGFIEIEKLHMLYKFAQALVFPSLYEGFGLPLIEAMASGCPVVAIDATAVPEIVADAAVLVEADNKDALIKAVMKVIKDKNFRAGLIDKGLRRAADFSWNKAVEDTIATYRDVLNE